MYDLNLIVAKLRFELLGYVVQNWSPVCQSFSEMLSVVDEYFNE